jgi:hypothetical protein
MSATALTAEQESLVQEITQEAVRAAESDIADIVRTVLSKKDRDVFGQTEFTVRDIIHKAAVKAFDAVLARKKNGYEGSSFPCPHCGQASMGPRSDNRGYAHTASSSSAMLSRLQWVHGRITVVMGACTMERGSIFYASMGPRSDNRGYVGSQLAIRAFR